LRVILNSFHTPAESIHLNKRFMAKLTKTPDTSPITKVRIDQWLWAARFYKTRSLAKTAVDGGKVHVEGQRVKPSKDITLGATLRIKQGWDDKTIIVTGLSRRRGNAKDAATLYEETAESIKARELNTEKRKLAFAATPSSSNRPNKKERRQILQLNQRNL
jgi:ribosome-associated heat shock protein Hsp15